MYNIAVIILLFSFITLMTLGAIFLPDRRE